MRPSFPLQLQPRTCSLESSPPLIWCVSTFYAARGQGPLIWVMIWIVLPHPRCHKQHVQTVDCCIEHPCCSGVSSCT